MDSPKRPLKNAATQNEGTTSNGLQEVAPHFADSLFLLVRSRFHFRRGRPTVAPAERIFDELPTGWD